jgi:SAM-dependent methyltransferase
MIKRMLSHPLRWVHRRILPLSWYHRLSLRARGASLHPRPINAPWVNSALKTAAAAADCYRQAREAGLRPHPDPPKNWDSLAALHRVLVNGRKQARILDAGGERYSRIGEWLCQYGYHDLDVINLAFDRPFRQGPIRFSPGDCTATEFDDETFDFITCLSVIEHGVPIPAFLGECHRLLKPGGEVIVSTDYWSEPVTTAGKEAYGVPVHIFTPDEIRKILVYGRDAGLQPTGDVDLSTQERVVHWDRHDLDYTFIVFSFRKPSDP